jgi:hypothetical protein
MQDQINQSERRQFNGSSSSHRKVSPSSGTGGDVGLRPHCHRHLRSRQRGYPEALGDRHPGRGCTQRAESHPPSGPSIPRFCGEHHDVNGRLTNTLSVGQGSRSSYGSLFSVWRVPPDIRRPHQRCPTRPEPVPLPRRLEHPGNAPRARHEQIEAPLEPQGLAVAPAQAFPAPHTLTPRAGTRRTRRAGRRPPRPAWPSP